MLRPLSILTSLCVALATARLGAEEWRAASWAATGNRQERPVDDRWEAPLSNQHPSRDANVELVGYDESSVGSPTGLPTLPPLAPGVAGDVSELTAHHDDDPLTPEYFQTCEHGTNPLECVDCQSALCLDGCSPWARLLPFASVPPSGDVGVGHERVGLATFFLDSAKPFSHVSFSWEKAWDVAAPDRSEFFWASPTTGPGAERSVDVNTLTARLELASGRTAAVFAAPLRSLDPEFNDNTAGIGDLVTGAKVALVDGNDWVLTHQTLTYLNTGPVNRGLGTGHVAMEPGLLARYRWTDECYLHGEVRYRIPISGTKPFAGEVLVWGTGVSWIACETDAFAILPTFEVVGHSFFDGARTTSTGTVVDVDGETAVELSPGVRFVLGPAGDLGLAEIGVSGGVNVGDRGWAAGRLMVEARWSF